MKPGLFKNELLAVADPINTVVFTGLWCLADREGRLEDRPTRIHFEINAGRAFAVTEQALAWLQENGFIERYEVDGLKCIQIISFHKHQKPHQREAHSELPPPRQCSDTTKAMPSRASSLNPSFLNPHSNGAPAALVFPDGFAMKEWEEWIAHRRKKRWPVDDLTLRKQIEVLAAYDAATQRTILATSINAGWQGIFHPKGVKPAFKPRDDSGQWEKLKARAESCGFRKPLPLETPAVYESCMRDHERELRMAR